MLKVHVLYQYRIGEVQTERYRCQDSRTIAFIYQKEWFILGRPLGCFAKCQEAVRFFLIKASSRPQEASIGP